MPETAERPVSPLVAACNAVAWLIAANKPVFPLYVWGLVGSGTWASALTAVSFPLWAALGWFGARRPCSMRAAIPLLGGLDTILAAKLFGAASLAELFFAPCALLAILSFRADEAWLTRALVSILFVAFVALHGRYGPPLHVWSVPELATLAEINILAVASLMAFLGWRFSGLSRA